MLALRLARPRCVAPAMSAVACLPGPSTLVAPLSTSAPRALPTDVKKRRPKHKQGMTPQKRAALRRATEFAQGIAGSTAEVAAASASAGAGTRDTLLQAPSRDELEYLRPRAEPRVNGGRYVRLHQKLFDSIDAAFVRAQLVALAEGWVDDEDVLRPIRGVRRLPKADIVQAIMDRWGWVKPVPLEVVKPRTQEFPLSQAELFLIQRDRKAVEYLGQFGRLNWSLAHVRNEVGGTVYLLTATSSPATLGEIANFLAAREYARLTWGEREMRGFTPAPATLWAVSTVTGAYVEAKADGTFVAIAGSMSDAQRARGILMAAAAAAAPDAPSNPRAVLLPSASKELTLTAHVPAMSAPLGWESHAAVAGRPLFRVTRAGAADWPAAREATQRAAHLDAAAVQALSDGVPSTLVDAGDATLSSLPSAEGERTLAVRFGHMLVPANSASVLTPPVSGTWPSTEWPALPSPVFTPALPPSLIQAPLHGTSRVRRVAYRRADGARLVVKYAYPRATPEPAKAEAKDAAVEPSWVKALNDMLAKGRTMPEEKRDEDEWDTDVNEQETDGGAARKKDPFEVDLAGLRSLLGEDKAVTAPAVAKPLVLSAVLSSETGIDMHLPDRPVDARLLARASQAVPQEDVPAEIADFFAQLHAYPSAAETALSDLAALRRGTGNGAPAPKEDKEDDLFWSSEDPDADGESEFEFREFDDKFEDKSAETETETADVGKDGKKDKNGRIPPPQPVAFEVDALLPPRSVSFAGDAWYLATDEVMDVSEETRRPAVFAASVKFGAGAAVPTEEGEGEVPVEVEADAEAEIETESSSATKHVPHSILAFVNTRTVAAVDLRGPGGVVRYAEIEAPAADARALYAHLANISRDVPLGI